MADPALMRIRLNIVRRHRRACDQPSGYDPKRTVVLPRFRRQFREDLIAASRPFLPFSRVTQAWTALPLKNWDEEVVSQFRWKTKRPGGIGSV